MCLLLTFDFVKTMQVTTKPVDGMLMRVKLAHEEDI